MVEQQECEFCGRTTCHGSCTNYILEMAMNGADVSEFDKLFRQIPLFNYVLTSKISSIFGTDLEIANASDDDTAKTREFNNLLYRTNENGVTNLHEIKKAVRKKEIYGEAYVFYDDIENNIYEIDKSELNTYFIDEEDAIIKKIAYYTIGRVELTDDDVIEFGDSGYIKQEGGGYIVSPSNIIKFKTDAYILNSDLQQLQMLMEINKKIYLTTTKKDMGDEFVFSDEPAKNVVSATFQRVKDTVNDSIKRMREEFAEMLKSNKTEDTNVIVLDPQYTKVQQVKATTTVKDYQFVWEDREKIMSSVINFPIILLNLGNESGNVSKEALIKDARANFLTPVKVDTANSLSVVAQKMFGDEFYLRFKDYPNEEL